MRNALKTHYPDSSFIACWFHFCQAVKKNASQFQGFVNFIRSNPAAEKIYYKLQCLPLLPAKYIDSAFNTLQDEALALNAAFKPFLNYYNRQWIVKVGSFFYDTYLASNNECFTLYYRRAHPKYLFLMKNFVQLVALKHTTTNWVSSWQKKVISIVLLYV